LLLPSSLPLSWCDGSGGARPLGERRHRPGTSHRDRQTIDRGVTVGRASRHADGFIATSHRGNRRRTRGPQQREYDLMVVNILSRWPRPWAALPLPCTQRRSTYDVHEGSTVHRDEWRRLASADQRVGGRVATICPKVEDPICGSHMSLVEEGKG
jgi:hypothetical protein